MRGLKGIRTRELYKFTLQQKAVQDILQAFTLQISVLDLGERSKLSQRGASLLLDLIKTKDLKEIRFADCRLQQDDLRQIKQVLLGKTESLVFRKTTTFGVEGTILLKAILQRQPVKVFGVWDCELNQVQLRNIIEALQKMKATKIKEINLRGNSLGADGIILLKQLISTKRIRKLVIANCYITSSHLPHLCDGINSMQGMMDLLNVRENLISKKDVDTLKKTVENKVLEILFY